MRKGVKQIYTLFLICGIGVMLSGCGAGLVKDAAILTGKAVVVTSKVVGKGLVATGKGIKTLVDIPLGRTVVPLEQRGNSFIVEALLNRSMWVHLLLDTGCSDTLISPRVAQRLRLSVQSDKPVMCTVADGRIVPGKAVIIRELRVGRAKVYDVPAVVLEREYATGTDGLLGMSFLNNFTFKVDADKNELVLQRRKEE